MTKKTTKEVAKKPSLTELTNFGDSKSTPSPIEDSKSFLDSLKVTWGMSGQFKDGTCELADFFFQDESLGKEIDMYIPYYGYQVLALKKPKEFKALAVFPHSNKAFRKDPRCIELIDKYKNVKKINIDIGVVVLGYLPEQAAWCSFFMKGSLNNTANKIVSKLEKGERYFQFKSVEKNDFINTKFTVLDKAEVDGFGLTDNTIMEKIQLLLDSGKEAEDENENEPTPAR